VGIGINIKTRPENIDQKITNIADHALLNGNRCEPATLFEFVLCSFHYWLAIWNEQGFAPIRNAWLKRAGGLNQPATVRLAHETFDGVFEGLDENGALLLRLANGSTRYVTAGDVFFAS
jgi:BirA family transcriptional regulator, biotin operon repressor / biotin---[acetyl-CoA-carboxylase] ligase